MFGGVLRHSRIVEVSSDALSALVHALPPRYAVP